MINQERMDIIGMIDDRFGELVELLKKERGDTLQELSDKTNLSPSYIYRLIKGYRGCELTTKLNILLNGFGKQKEAELYLRTVIENKETLRKILD
ncbi:helix-turn-helix domain-containing protein [Sediminibacillus terrae]|uniref:helix-turn-helix domain-containing protein n=1 Tax=Sediminibacillus terrae TaxID=1562106 RepID=UPI0012981E28|nr:helix-turn-helix transcriptional regulator [Sediminibacillus terrae]